MYCNNKVICGSPFPFRLFQLCVLLQSFLVRPVSSNISLQSIITASYLFASILGFVLKVIFSMCHLPRKSFGLLHSKVVPRNMVHVIFALANCVEACVMPLIYTLEWISLNLVLLITLDDDSTVALVFSFN